MGGGGEAVEGFYGGADGDEFDEAVADFGDIGFYPDDLIGAQGGGLAAQAGDGVFAARMRGRS